MTHHARLAVLFMAAHFLTWWIVAVITQPALPMDTLEKVLWGQEWQWFYYRHPPLASWLAAAAHAVGGEVLVKALSPLSVTFAFWAVWLLAREWFSPMRSLVAILLLEGIVYFNFNSPEFNENIISLPAWAFFGLFGWRAYSRNNMTDWILCGFFAALCLLSKYSGALIIAAWFCAMMIQGRQRLLSPNAAAGFATMALLCAATIWGLWQKDFESITDFAISRAEKAQNIGSHIFYPMRFFLAQLSAHIPFLIMCLALVYGGIKNARIKMPPLEPDACRYLFIICFLPFVFALLLSALTGLRLQSAWGSMMWPFIGIFAVFCLSRFHWNLRRFAFCWVFFFALGVFAYGAKNVAGPFFREKGSRVHFPASSFATQIEAKWRERYPEQPLTYVIGSSGVAGSIAYYGESGAHFVMDGSLSKNYWLDRSDLRQKGGVLVWRVRGSGAPSFVKDFPSAQMQDFLFADWLTAAPLPPVTLGWMILPPAGQ